MNYAFRLCLFLLCTLSATVCTAEQPEDPSIDRPEPLVVLIERNPWLMVVGSDSPTFALYTDGLVIFRDADYQHHSLRLDEQQKRELLSEIAPESILDLKEGYETSSWTDQPTNELYVWVGGERKRVDVYGDLRRDRKGASTTAREEWLEAAPPAYLRAFDAIVGFTPEAAAWLPEQIEVLIWPFEYSREEPLAWPAGWPSLETAQRAAGSDLRRLFLPASEFPRLQRLMNERDPRQAIELTGRKWSISFRFPFPNESAWMR